MKIKAVVSRLNRRLILVHVLAVLCLMDACKVFSYFYNIEILKGILHHDKTAMEQEGFSDFYYLTILAPLIGVLVGFIISLWISISNKWFWLNSVIVLLIAFVLLKSGLFIDDIRRILNTPGSLISNVMFKTITNGTIAFGASLFLFFSVKLRAYISKANKLTTSSSS